MRTAGPLTLVLAAAACSEERDATVEPAGRWNEARWERLEEEIAELEAIGYADGTREATDRSDVTVHVRERAYAGANLFVSGHAPAAFLVDMDGNELHAWSFSFAKAVPGSRPGRDKRLARDYWRRVHLYENGDLLAIFEGSAMIKLDARSNLLWTFTEKPHHDMFVREDGRIYVLTRSARLIPRISEEEPVLEDFISILDSSGVELERVSVLESFENSDFALLTETTSDSRDVLHTNTIELVDERLAHRIPGVSEGNVLISCRHTNTVAIVDMEARSVVWAMANGWEWQHQPTALENGNILLFDNLGGSRFGRSRVIELDTVSGDFEWVYDGTADANLYTRTCGSCQRLPNGNTLITESDNGRAIEVAPNEQIVWEYLNPHRAGPDGRLVATLFEMIRLPADFPLEWIDASR